MSFYEPIDNFFREYAFGDVKINCESSVLLDNLSIHKPRFNLTFAKFEFN